MITLSIKKMTLALAIPVGLIFTSHHASAQTYKFHLLNSSRATELRDINNSNVSAGDIIDSTGVEHCYMVTASSATPINDPKGLTTSCFGINNLGAITGSYPSGSFGNGFIYSAGTFTDVIVPTATAGTIAYDVNDAGVIVGEFSDDIGTHGFFKDGNGYHTVDAPGASSFTGIGGINASGQMVMQASVGGAISSFLYSGGVFTPIVFPGSTATYAHNVNAAGIVTMGWLDSNAVEHGGLFNSANGKYYQVDDAAGVKTAITGINDGQTICGIVVLTNGGADKGFYATGHIPAK